MKQRDAEVLKERILDAVRKSVEWKGDQIEDLDMKQLSERILGILSPPSEASEQRLCDVSKEEILDSVFGNKGLDLREITSKPLYAIYQAMQEYAEEYASRFTSPSVVTQSTGVPRSRNRPEPPVVTQSEKGEQSHRKALKILEENLGDYMYNNTGHLHNNISNAMHEFAQEYSLLERSRAIDECIESATEGRTVRTDLIKTLEKLKSRQ